MLYANFYLEPKNHFVANFIGNPVIDNFAVTVENDEIKASDFTIKVSDLDKQRLRKQLVDGNYILSVRPENITPADNGELAAQIVDVELIGRERILKFNHDGQQARSLVNLEVPIKAGDKVRLKLRLDRIFIFTPEGERVY